MTSSHDDGAQGRLARSTEVARRVVNQSLRDDVMGLSAELAYRFFLALFPFMIFVASFGATLAQSLGVQNPARAAVQLLSEVLPSEAAAMAEQQLEQIIDQASAGLASVGVITAIFFATGGTNAIIKAMNRAYSVGEGRPVWRRYVVAIALTIVAGVGLLTAFVLFVPVRLFGPQLAQTVGLGELGPLVVNVIAVIGALVLLVTSVTVIYRVAPNIKLPLRAVLPGALLFAAGWLVVAFGFSFYVSNFGNYANTYGALAGVVVMLLFFYLSSFVLLVAAEVNEVLHELSAPEDVERRRAESRAEAERD